MATSKTLTPTNVTISIPEMTDSPDASVFSNCVDKEADAINSLNSNLTRARGTLGASELTTPTSILNYPAGEYSITNPDAANFPFKYGTASIFKTDGTYGYVLAKQASIVGGIYIRHFNGTSWHESEWQELALNSNLSNYMTIRNYGSSTSATSIKNHIIGMMDDAIADTTFPTSAYCPIKKALTGQDEYSGIAMKLDSSHGQLIVWDSSNHMYRCMMNGNTRYVGEFTGTNM